MKFVVKNTSRGWEIELCKPIREGSKYFHTAKLQWRTLPENLNPDFIYEDYEEAKDALERRKSEK